MGGNTTDYSIHIAAGFRDRPWPDLFVERSLRNNEKHADTHKGRFT